MNKLTNLYNDLASSVSDGFASSFIHIDLHDLKKEYRDEVAGFYFKVKQFQEHAGPKVKCLEAEQVRLNRTFLAGKSAK